jgi:hypothetical protein
VTLWDSGAANLSKKKLLCRKVKAITSGSWRWDLPSYIQKNTYRH